MSAAAVRVIENWIVGVVTVVSAGVILVTLLAHQDGPTPPHSPGQVAIEAAAIH